METSIKRSKKAELSMKKDSPSEILGKLLEKEREPVLLNGYETILGEKIAACLISYTEPPLENLRTYVVGYYKLNQETDSLDVIGYVRWEHDIERSTLTCLTSTGLPRRSEYPKYLEDLANLMLNRHVGISTSIPEIKYGDIRQRRIEKLKREYKGEGIELLEEMSNYEKDSGHPNYRRTLNRHLYTSTGLGILSINLGIEIAKKFGALELWVKRMNEYSLRLVETSGIPFEISKYGRDLEKNAVLVISKLK